MTATTAAMEGTKARSVCTTKLTTNAISANRRVRPDAMAAPSATLANAESTVTCAVQGLARNLGTRHANISNIPPAHSARIGCRRPRIVHSSKPNATTLMTAAPANNAAPARPEKT